MWILLYTLNDALYQVKIEEVVISSNAGSSDVFKQIVSSPMVGIFDTGSSFILGPTADINAFASRAGATRVGSNSPTSYFLNPCNTSNIPSLSFIIQGKEYVLSGSDLVIHVVRCTYSCSGNLFSWLLIFSQ